MMTKPRYDDPAPISRTYQPNKTLTVPGDPMVIAAPHAAKDIEDAHTTPSPTPPVAAIATTLQPAAASPKEDLMRKMMTKL